MISLSLRNPHGRDPARLIFVAGLHRSGTTPLARAIVQHPDVSGLTNTGVKEDEGQHLQQVYPAARVYGGPGRFARDPRAHLTETASLVAPERATQLWDSWEPYWDLSHPYLVEKSPPNLVMGRFLQALFPGSAYVAVIRHPVVVALSTVKWRRRWSRRWWNHISVEQMIEHWLLAHQTFRADFPLLKRVHVLRYEDLVADPSGQLAAVSDLVGLVTPIPIAGIEARSDRYEQQWQEMTNGVLSRRKRQRIIEKFGPAVAEFGYDITDLTGRPESPVNLFF
ncbi:MAG: sulfotransferase family protein [Actinomycetota bacterium]